MNNFCSLRLLDWFDFGLAAPLPLVPTYTHIHTHPFPLRASNEKHTINYDYNVGMNYEHVNHTCTPQTPREKVALNFCQFIEWILMQSQHLYLLTNKCSELMQYSFGGERPDEHDPRRVPNALRPAYRRSPARFRWMRLVLPVEGAPSR